MTQDSHQFYLWAYKTLLSQPREKMQPLENLKFVIVSRVAKEVKWAVQDQVGRSLIAHRILDDIVRRNETLNLLRGHNE